MKTILAETSTTSYQLSSSSSSSGSISNSKKSKDIDEHPTNGQLQMPMNSVASQSSMEYGSININKPLNMNTAQIGGDVFQQQKASTTISVASGYGNDDRAELATTTTQKDCVKVSLSENASTSLLGSGHAGSIRKDSISILPVTTEKTRSSSGNTVVAQATATQKNDSENDAIVHVNNNVKHSHSLRRHMPRIVMKPIVPEKKVEFTSCSNMIGGDGMSATTTSVTATTTVAHKLQISRAPVSTTLTRSGPSRRAHHQQQQQQQQLVAQQSKVDGTTGIPSSVITQASTMREVLASIPGFSIKPRRRSSKKISTAAQIEQTKDGKIDLETPDSILASTNLRALLNKHTFSLLPPLYQYNLIQLLPLVDREAIELDHKCSTVFTVPTIETVRMGASSLNNEFFARACLEWRERLSEGEFTPENQNKLRTEAERERNKLDPWKLKHFEPIWGEKSQRSHSGTVNSGCDESSTTTMVLSTSETIANSSDLVIKSEPIVANIKIKKMDEVTASYSMKMEESTMNTDGGAAAVANDCGNVLPSVENLKDVSVHRHHKEQELNVIDELDCDDTDSASRCTVQDIQEHSEKSRLTDASSSLHTSAGTVDSDSGVVLPTKFNLKRSISSRLGETSASSSIAITANAMNSISDASMDSSHSQCTTQHTKLKKCVSEVEPNISESMCLQPTSTSTTPKLIIVKHKEQPCIMETHAFPARQKSSEDHQIDAPHRSMSDPMITEEDGDANGEKSDTTDAVTLSLMHYLNETDLEIIDMEIPNETTTCRLPANDHSCSPTEEEKEEDASVMAKLSDDIATIEVVNVPTKQPKTITPTATDSVKQSACDTINQSSMLMTTTTTTILPTITTISTIKSQPDNPQCIQKIAHDLQDIKNVGDSIEQYRIESDYNNYNDDDDDDDDDEEQDCQFDGVCGKKMRFSCINDMSTVADEQGAINQYGLDTVASSSSTSASSAGHMACTPEPMVTTARDYQQLSSSSAILNGPDISSLTAFQSKTTSTSATALSSSLRNASIKRTNEMPKTTSTLSPPLATSLKATTIDGIKPSFDSSSNNNNNNNNNTLVLKQSMATTSQALPLSLKQQQPSTTLELFQQVVQHDWNFGLSSSISTKCDQFGSEQHPELPQLPDGLTLHNFQPPAHQSIAPVQTTSRIASDSLDPDFSGASTSIIGGVTNECIISDVCQYTLDENDDDDHDDGDDDDDDDDNDNYEDEDNQDDDGDESEKSGIDDIEKNIDGEAENDDEADVIDADADDDEEGDDDDDGGEGEELIIEQCNALSVVGSEDNNAGSDEAVNSNDCDTVVGNIVEQLQQQQQQQQQQYVSQPQSLLNSNSHNTTQQPTMGLFLPDSKLFGGHTDTKSSNPYGINAKVDFTNNELPPETLCNVVPFAVADMEVSSTVVNTNNNNGSQEAAALGKMNLNFHHRPQQQQQQQQQHQQHLQNPPSKQLQQQQQPQQQQHQILVDSNGHIIGNILVQHQHTAAAQLLQQNIAQQFTIQSSSMAATTPQQQQQQHRLVATTTGRPAQHQQQQQQKQLFQSMSIMRKQYDLNTDVQYSANPHNSFVSQTMAVQNAVAAAAAASQLPQMQQIITTTTAQPRHHSVHQQQHAASAVLDGTVKLSMPTAFGDRLAMPVTTAMAQHIHLNQAKLQTLPAHLPQQQQQQQQQHLNHPQLDTNFAVGMTTTEIVPVGVGGGGSVASAVATTTPQQQQHYAPKQINLITIPRTVGKCPGNATSPNLPASLGCGSSTSTNVSTTGMNTFAYVSTQQQQPHHHQQQQQSSSNYSLIANLTPAVAAAAGSVATSLPNLNTIKLMPTTTTTTTTTTNGVVSVTGLVHPVALSSPSPPHLSVPIGTAMRLAPIKSTTNKTRKVINNKLPPGAVNLERSYQICQAVIQNSPNRENLKAQLRPPPSIFSQQQHHQQQQQQQHNTSVGNVTSVPKGSPSLVSTIAGHHHHQHHHHTMTPCITNVVASSVEEMPANMHPSSIAATNVMGMGRPGVYKVIGPNMRFPRKKYVQRKSPTVMREVLALQTGGGGGGGGSNLIHATLAQQLALMPKTTFVQQQQQQQHPTTTTEIHRNNGQYVLVHHTNIVKADNQTPRASSAPPIPQNQNQLHINGMPITGRGRPASVDVDTSVNMLNDIQNIGYANVHATNTAAANSNARNITAGVDVSQGNTDDDRIMEMATNIANECNNHLGAITLSTATATPTDTSTVNASLRTTAVNTSIRITGSALTRPTIATAVGTAVSKDKMTAANTNAGGGVLLLATATVPSSTSPCYVSDAVKNNFTDTVLHCNSRSSSNSNSSNSSSTIAATGGISNGYNDAILDGNVNNTMLNSSKHASTASNCGCSLNAMVICKECGAFIHKDCMNSSKLCLACLTR